MYVEKRAYEYVEPFSCSIEMRKSTDPEETYIELDIGGETYTGEVRDVKALIRALNKLLKEVTN